MKKMVIILALLNIYANSQNLRNMYFLTENIGWVQTDSFSFSTNDGGITWKELPKELHYKGRMYYYTGIDFVNDSIGYLQNKNYQIYKTTNKGGNWKEIEVLSGSPSGINFIDEMNGYASGRYITKTTNGGVTWDSVFEEGDFNFEIVSKDKVFLLAIENYGKCYKTKNGGINWVEVTFFGKANDIQFTDSLHGFITLVDGDPQSGIHWYILRTIDGGENWSDIQTNISYELSMADSLNGIAFTGNYYHLTNDGFLSFTDKDINTKTRDMFFYDCKAFYACGDSGYFAKSTDCGETWTELPFNVLNSTDFNEKNNIITNYYLQQNYPNPFNPSTKIKFTLPKQGLVTIKVFDVLGNEIMNLVNEEKPSGEYEVEFDGSNLSSGIYFYQIQAGEFLNMKKMILLK
ncbi:MAG: YCF48-related protein [Syntrophothermus sp.]